MFKNKFHFFSKTPLILIGLLFIVTSCQKKEDYVCECWQNESFYLFDINETKENADNECSSLRNKWQRQFSNGFVDCYLYNDNEPQMPKVTTDTVTFLSTGFIKTEGNVTDDGNSHVFRRGVCWSTIRIPTINDSILLGGRGVGSFSTQIIDVNPQKKYFLRAFAENRKGIAYGNILDLNMPETIENFSPVYCNGSPTAVVDVINPITGKIWMDRNLGASRAAISSTDTQAYGDLYQWGRRTDEHQCRNSATTTNLSSTNTPVHGSFILAPNSPNDWRSPQNTNLWQGVNGVNNPCPSGYRLPTETELNAERTSWSSNNAAGAFASPLKLPMAGSRGGSFGSLGNVGTSGLYWSSTVSNTNSRHLNFNSSSASMTTSNRAIGRSVRCIKDYETITDLKCDSASNNGTLVVGVSANSVSSEVPYTSGNGGLHNGQSVNSTGVIGLTATLNPGSFANGTGSLTYIITGTPNTSGTANFVLNIGGQSCTLRRTVEAGTISALNCNTATNNGTLTAGVSASGVNSVVPYTGGNGGTHNGQTVNSTGVTGLTATLSSGSFASGAGNLTYTITGTPSAAGTANFALNIGGQTCTLNRIVANQPSFPSNTVHCSATPTLVVDVVNPVTGKTWMDRNLGASRAATSSTDAQAYGDLYQWGRRADGHQCRNSSTTSTLSSTNTPPHGDFIQNSNPSLNLDWRNPQNSNLWQGTNGINNPCPNGYRLPTETELNSERMSWSSNNSTGAFGSPLKLCLAGYRGNGGGIPVLVGTNAGFWSSSINTNESRYLNLNSSFSSIASHPRASGFSVRCIKN